MAGEVSHSAQAKLGETTLGTARQSIADKMGVHPVRIVILVDGRALERSEDVFPLEQVLNKQSVS